MSEEKNPLLFIEIICQVAKRIPDIKAVMIGSGALEKIVELENITPSDEELEAEFAKLAEGYGVEVEKVKAVIPAEEISKDVAVGKAIDLVKENAVITEVEEKKAEE